MKKVLFLGAIVFSFAIILSSCGSSKKVATIDPYGNNSDNEVTRVKLEREECEVESLEANEFLRGYGVGTSADMMFARDMASTAARNEIVNQVQVSASNMFEKFNNQHSSNSSQPAMTRDDQGKATQMIRSIAEETLSGARVICSNTYKVGNNYEVHVCVELTNVDFAKQVYSKLSNEEKLMIDFEADRFKKSMDEELRLYREDKAAGKR